MTPHQEFAAGARDIAPLALGVAFYGMAFGLLAAQAQMDALQTGVMGAVVFAGASQIVAVERLVAGAGALTALLAGVALNLRLLLITASLRDDFAGRPLWQIALGAHMATDENWALLHATRGQGLNVGYWYLIGGGAALWITWVGSTALGVGLAAAIPEPRALGVDFAFTAAFIALLRGLWRGRADIAPWAISAAAAALLVFATPVDPSAALVLSALLGVAFAGGAGDD